MTQMDRWVRRTGHRPKMTGECVQRREQYRRSQRNSDGHGQSAWMCGTQPNTQPEHDDQDENHGKRVRVRQEAENGETRKRRRAYEGGPLDNATCFAERKHEPWESKDIRE